MYHIAILDDDYGSAKLLEYKIKKLTSNFIVHVYQKAEDLLGNMIYDAYFIDVEMPVINGFSVAKRIHKEQNVPIIFVTAHEHYAMEGYEFNAFRFVSKIATDKQLPKVICDLNKQIMNHKSYLIGRSEGCYTKINIKDIIYLYSEGNYVYIIEQGKEEKTTRIRSSIRKLTDQLPEEEFFMPCSGWIVHLDHITEIHIRTNELRMSNGCKIQCSRLKKKGLIQAYKKRLGK
ncbi:MAG: LytTR family DNA-binding domain-containing protein [Erysipelotrichaceae bacterium]|nr:LytTR family DNA-binding domain-containing protein [Erysipelotrichaceae bacterium]